MRHFAAIGVLVRTRHTPIFLQNMIADFREPSSLLFRFIRYCASKNLRDAFYSSLLTLDWSPDEYFQRASLALWVCFDFRALTQAKSNQRRAVKSQLISLSHNNGLFNRGRIYIYIWNKVNIGHSCFAKTILPRKMSNVHVRYEFSWQESQGISIR